MKILPVFIPHFGCPFRCIYCDQKIITKSQLPNISLLQKKIKFFCENNANEKKQVAFFGGTFTSLNKKNQTKLLDSVKPFLNELNGIRISTRPDAIDEKILSYLRSKNVRTIELGIQSFSNKILEKTKRGYTREIAIQNSELIKSKKIELGIQLMPGLPGFSEKSLSETIKFTKLIKPNFVRIYPTIILKNTKLAELYYSQKYRPLSLEKAISITAKMITELADINIAKVGLHSDIDEKDIIAGPFHKTFGELVRAEILYNKIINNFQNKTLVISKFDISLFKGFNGEIIRKIKQTKMISKLPIIIDENMKKNNFLFTNKRAEQIW